MSLHHSVAGNMETADDAHRRQLPLTIVNGKSRQLSRDISPTVQVPQITAVMDSKIILFR